MTFHPSTALASKPEILKVMTLNVAHARCGGPGQLLLSVHQARQNLWRIARVVQREQPHVVAFQEIDQGSFWNGDFDHTACIAEAARYQHHFTGLHMQTSRLRYGTALMATSQLADPLSVRFDPGLVRPPKGFVISTVDWPGAGGIDFVSVHFDFLSSSKRLLEARQLVDSLSARSNPVVIMGDFNADLAPRSRLLPFLQQSLGLTTWQPGADIVTFPRLRRRLDWILVSDGIEIVSHEVLPDLLSDHRAVIAGLRLMPPARVAVR